MNTKEAVLEYSVANANDSTKGSWGFKFKTRSGEVLINSAGYASLDQAQQGFVSLVKSIARNDYSVQMPGTTGEP